MGRLREERGFAAVMVVISLVGLFGAALLSIDTGSVWKTRRQLIIGTDAGALAAARYVVKNGEDACRDGTTGGKTSAPGSEAEYVLHQNDADARMVDFSVHPYSGDCSRGAGHVRVDGRLPAHLTVAGVFGITDVDAFAASTAQYGPLSGVIGARPVGICDKSEHFEEWRRFRNGQGGLGSGPGHPDYGGPIVHRIYYQKGSSGCGTGAGSWDWLDFNASLTPNGTTMLREWLYNGYPNEVSVGDSDTGKARDCSPEISGNQDGCPPKTGAGGGSFIDALEWLRDNQVVFPIMVYNKVVDDRDPAGCSAPPPWTGSGENARFCHVAFLLVRLHGWSKITGQQSDDSYIDMEFVDDLWIGSIGANPSGDTPTVSGVQLCGTEYGGTFDNQCDV